MPVFDNWLTEVSPSWPWQYKHLRYIRRMLKRVTSGEIKRLMVFLPPRHYKSELVTVRYAAWRLERNPTMRVIIGAYNQTLANRFSRKSRRIAETRIPLAADRTAVEEWDTEAGGTFRAVGVGAGITGQGGDLIIIDDPVKSRDEAESQAYRDKVWDWYTDDLYTRMESDSAIILIMCMTGDTPVLMADGTELPLRDVKVGDKVATYDHGKLATSTVQNHKSNGPDSIYRIRTKCGKIVHANERHPFLVQEHGQLKWIRLKDLTTGHTIVTVKGNGASGKAKRVPFLAARLPLAARVTARPITPKRCGLMGTAHHRITQKAAAIRASSTATVSPQPSMTLCTRRKVAGALSANSRRGTTYARTGAASYALTTVTKRIASEGFCATTATLPWATPRQKRPHSLLPNISDFTTAQIESIEPAGVEEVFDIQIERTENFIANGLVSHNTRWHEDDLAGRILASEQAAQWTVISLPAEAEEGDPLGREVGEALCPEKFDKAALADRRSVLGNSYYALYQQRPQPKEGDFFKRQWFPITDVLATGCALIRYWDNAGTAGGGDYTAGVLMARSLRREYFVVDVVRGQWSPGEREKVKRQTAELDRLKYGHVQIWNEQEPGSAGKESAQATAKNLEGFSFHAETATGDKAVRAEPFAAQAEAGNVSLIRGVWNGGYLDELTGFPTGKRKDQVDGSSGGFNKLALRSEGEIHPDVIDDLND